MTIARRLRPGEDLKLALQSLAAASEIEAGVVLSLVGSLSSARLRLAGGGLVKELDGPLEIVSATGTISRDGCHIHIAVADSTGTTCGGHLLPGCTIFTTVELVILDLSKTWRFDRAQDPDTGYRELVITRASNTS